MSIYETYQVVTERRCDSAPIVAGIFRTLSEAQEEAKWLCEDNRVMVEIYSKEGLVWRRWE